MNELQPLIDVGQRLRTIFQETIDSCPGLSYRPIEMAKALNVDKSMTSRLCSALRSDDPVAMLGMFPGAVPLKQFLRAVGAGGGDRGAIDAAHVIIDEFEALVKAEFDDRTGLNAVVATVVPEIAKRHELKAKQDAFRAFETFRGISADWSVTSFFLHPNCEDHNWVDGLLLNGLYGLRRIRPGAAIQLSFPGRTPRNYVTHPLGLDKNTPVFREFCRPSDLEVSRQDLPNEPAFHLAGSTFGRSSAVDVVVVDYQIRTIPLEPPSGAIRAFGMTIEDPIKYFVMDLLVHESLWPDKNYELRIYDAAGRGRRKLTPSNVDTNLLYVNESVELLGCGIKRLRSTKIPRYFEMIETTTQRMGWDPESFRCYRCQIDYPVYGSEIALVQTPYPAVVETNPAD